MKTLKTKHKMLGKIILPNPEAGDIKLNVFPFIHNSDYIKLPKQFKEYEESLNTVMFGIPIQKGAQEHYVTIDSKFFSKTEYLRREGVHLDGNFCADPNFKGATWGGIEPMPTWGGVKCSKENNDWNIIKNWVSEHPIKIPLGTYVSDDLGGIIMVSNEVGCQGWIGKFNGWVGPEGELSSFKGQFTDDKKIIFDKDEVWLVSSNLPHETLLIDKAKRRTFMRITLAHNYKNKQLFN